MKWLYVLAGVIVLFVILITSQKGGKNLNLTSEDLLKTDPEDVERLYTLHRYVDELFEKEKIPYFAIAGTLLGAVRHGGVIPWDDDLDIAIFNEDLPKVFGLRETLLENGYDIAVFGAGIKIYYVNGNPIRNTENAFYEWKFPWIDLFLMEPDHQGRVVYSIERIRDAFGQKEWFYKKDVDDLKRLPFGRTTIPVPTQWIDYLNRVYGPNWNTTAYKDYDHSQEQFLEKIPVPIVNFRISSP